jgi:hypothetical protein
LDGRRCALDDVFVEELVFLGAEGDAESVANDRMRVWVRGRHLIDCGECQMSTLPFRIDRELWMRRRRGEDVERRRNELARISPLLGWQLKSRTAGDLGL